MALVPCPSCGAKFEVGSFAPGKKLRCSKCKEVFAVPTADPVPAAVSKKETRTSFQKKSSSVSPKAAAAAPEAPKRPKSSKSLKAAPPEPDPVAEPEASQPEKSKAKLALIGVVVAVLGGGIFMAMPSDEEPATAETYEQRVARNPNPGADDHARIALWCVTRKDLINAEKHLDKALAAGSKAKQLEEAAQLFYWRKRLGIDADQTDKRLDLAEWCGKFGLEVFRKAECNRVLAVDKKNDRATKILGSGGASTGGDGGGEVDWEAEMAAKKAQQEEDKRILDGLDDWHKASYKYHVDIRNSGLLGKEFTRYDEKPPYAVFVEGTEAFDEKEVAEKFSKTLGEFWAVFQKELGGKTGVPLDKTPFFVNVFASRARYDEMASREQMPLRPDGYIKNIEGNLHLFTWSEGDVNKPYLWHDGFHVLFATTTKLKSGSNPVAYWVNEGLALAFEAAAKAGKDSIGGIDPDRLPTIQQEFRLDPAKRKILGLSTLAGKSSSDVISELKSTQGSEEDKFERQKKAEALMAQAWSFVAYLLSTPEDRAKLEAYCEREWSGKGGLSAFTEVFGEAAGMAEKWKSFVEESK